MPMLLDLVAASDLDDFPGAPYSDAVVASAAASIRRDAGWHIAPTTTLTLNVDSSGGPLLALPVRELTDVTTVRDMTDPDNPVELTGWRKSRAGMLSRRGGWPQGFEAVEVTFSSGFNECPADLLQVIAERCQAAGIDHTVRSEAGGAESITYAAMDRSAQSIDPRIMPYALGTRP